jgi:hypothetical protein
MPWREAVGECGVGRKAGREWGEMVAAGGEKRGREQPLGPLSGGAEGPVGVELEQVVGCGD